ncbi:conserved hypothetical protein [Aeromonas salmonicida]|nr:conserved hypothetical protein [Aeromonas salmonicida]
MLPAIPLVQDEPSGSFLLISLYFSWHGVFYPEIHNLIGKCVAFRDANLAPPVRCSTAAPDPGVGPGLSAGTRLNKYGMAPVSARVITTGSGRADLGVWSQST